MGYRKKGYRKGEMQERKETESRVQDRTYAEHEICWTGGMPDRWDARRFAGKEGCKKERMQERRYGIIRIPSQGR